MSISAFSNGETQTHSLLCLLSIFGMTKCCGVSVLRDSSQALKHCGGLCCYGTPLKHCGGLCCYGTPQALRGLCVLRLCYGTPQVLRGLCVLRLCYGTPQSSASVLQGSSVCATGFCVLHGSVCCVCATGFLPHDTAFVLQDSVCYMALCAAFVLQCSMPAASRATGLLMTLRLYYRIPQVLVCA